MKKLFNVLAVWLLLCSAHAEEKILPVDEAFKQSLSVDGGHAVLNFDIADGYYLYRHALKFKGVNVILGEATIPEGKKKTDEFFGEVETYRKQLSITVPFSDVQPGALLEYKFQGCADLGICYPPQKRNFDLPIKDASSHVSTLPIGQQSTSFFGGATSMPASEAFRYEVIALSENQLSARFTMAPNIYLYKDQVLFSSFTSGVQLGKPVFPKAVKKDDPEFGLVDVYYGVVEVTIPYTNSQVVKKVDIEAAFQGCEDGKICYPPESRMVSVDLPGASMTQIESESTANQTLIEDSKENSELSETQQLTHDIASKSWFWVVIQFLGLGLLLSVTPCVYPMIPILSSLIVGQKNPSTGKAFVLSLTYVLAMALTYTLVGVVAGMMGANLQAMFQKPEIIIAFSVVFVLLSLSMFGFYDLQLPQSWQNKLSAISNKQKGGSVIGVAIMGLLSALVVGPCVAPPLAAAVIYISSNDSGAFMGGVALFAMSFGMGMPLIAIGTSAGKWMPSSGGWMNVVKSFFGIALLGMAVWFMSRILNANVVLFMWGGLLLVSAMMWHRHAKDNGLSGAAMGMVEGIKVLALAVGMAQLIGAMAGGTDPIRPLSGLFSGGGQVSEQEGLKFNKIKSLAELQQTIKASDKPVYFDFYADWCVECIRMEKTTFKEPEIVKLGAHFTLLKADVTANDEVDAELMQYFQVVGPPASLFFAPGGEPLLQQNFFGYKSANDLKQTFEMILK